RPHIGVVVLGNRPYKTRVVHLLLLQSGTVAVSAARQLVLLLRPAGKRSARPDCAGTVALWRPAHSHAAGPEAGFGDML
ncbi:MAG TPA: hypothetical protein VL133_11835, partial [Devosia sp.]|nr:hypothetical protein [Devosia sp.]